MNILNKPTADMGLLRTNYDKLLHISIGFIILLWTYKLVGTKVPLGQYVALIVWLVLCVAKTAYNFKSDSKYNPLGDWIANLTGLGLWVAWLCI